MEAVTKGACLSWKEGMHIYHDKKHERHKEIKKIIDESRASITTREKGEDVFFDPPSQVARGLQTGMTHYVDLAFLTEQDMLNIFKLGAKDLGIRDKLVTRVTEDGNGACEGVYMRMSDLEGLSFLQVMGLRKTRVWYQASLESRGGLGLG